MAALEFVGNFESEIGQLKAITDAVSSGASSIKDTVSGMSSYWQDAKSETFITSTESLCDEIVKLAAKAQSDGEEGLNEIAKALNIY